jgi:hypothetical protein
MWLGILVIAVMVYLCTVEMKSKDPVNDNQHAATSISAKDNSKLPTDIELP